MTRLAAFLILALCTSPVFAAESYTVVLKDHEFTPRMLQVPFDRAFVLVVRNEDTTPAALDSKSLGIEREIIEGSSSIELKLRPLKFGTYDLYDPFHIGAQGWLVARN